MEKLESFHQLTCYTPWYAQFSKNYLCAHLSKHFTDFMHMSSQVPFIKLMKFCPSNFPLNFCSEM